MGQGLLGYLLDRPKDVDLVGAIVTNPAKEGVTVGELLGGKSYEVMGRHGCLFAIPSRSVIVCCPVEDARILQAISAFIPLVIELFEAGPGSISPSLYWFDRRRYHSLPVDAQRKAVEQSDGLNELVKRLEYPQS